MKITPARILIPTAIAATLSFGGMAFADRDEARAMSEAKISLVEAIQAVEAAHGGRAYEASIDDDSFDAEYEVSILRDDRSYDVRVNAVTGQVYEPREDRDD